MAKQGPCPVEIRELGPEAYVIEDEPVSSGDSRLKSPDSSAKFTGKGLLAIESKAMDQEWIFAEPHQVDPEITDKAAIVTVRGPLNHHHDVRFDSYDKILPRVEAAFQSNAPGVLLDTDSPGGEVSGCFNTAKALISLKQKYNKPLIGYISGQASSAMYALMCACDTIVIPSEGVAGSVGVFAEITSKARLMRSMGIDVEMVASGERKLDGNPMVPITKEALANIREGVMQQAGVFWSWVASRRTMLSLDTVKSYEGRSFHGASAVGAGLADVVGSFSEALGMVSGATAINVASSGNDKGNSMSHLRKMLLDEAAEDTEDGHRAKKALEAYDAKEPVEEPDWDKPGDKEEPKDKPSDERPSEDEPDGDEGRRASSSRRASRAQDTDEAKRAESEEGDAKRCEDEASKAEDEASDEDAKARKALRAKAYNEADDHMSAAVRLRNRAANLRGTATRCLKDAGIYRALAKSNAMALKAQDTRASATPSLAAIAARGTQGSASSVAGKAAGDGLEIFSEQEKVALGLAPTSSAVMQFEGQTLLGLPSPEQAAAVVKEIKARVAQLGGRN